MLKIKGWERFQHFKDRRPVWIKLYRDLLDDHDWHKLPGDDAKMLVMLWLISSEQYGELPSIEELAFRLRITEKSMTASVTRLSRWLINDDIRSISDEKLISGEYQNNITAIPLARSQEKRREETETEQDIGGFELFWKTYPKKKAKPAAEKAFKTQRINGELPAIIADIENKIQSADWKKDGGQFIPYPASYLNSRRWEDGLADDVQSGGLVPGAI